MNKQVIRLRSFPIPRPNEIEIETDDKLDWFKFIRHELVGPLSVVALDSIGECHICHYLCENPNS